MYSSRARYQTDSAITVLLQAHRCQIPLPKSYAWTMPGAAWSLPGTIPQYHAWNTCLEHAWICPKYAAYLGKLASMPLYAWNHPPAWSLPGTMPGSFLGPQLPSMSPGTCMGPCQGPAWDQHSLAWCLEPARDHAWILPGTIASKHGTWNLPGPCLAPARDQSCLAWHLEPAWDHAWILPGTTAT